MAVTVSVSNKRRVLNKRSRNGWRLLLRWWPVSLLILYGLISWQLATSLVEEELQSVLPASNKGIDSSSALKRALLDSANPKKEARKSVVFRGKTLQPAAPQSQTDGLVFKLLKQQNAVDILQEDTCWALTDPLLTPTRNHETVLLEFEDDKIFLVNILGRHSRVVQWTDLQTGEQKQQVAVGNDPAGKALNDLNHVASVVVDRIEDWKPSHDVTMAGARKEVWVPCGFHNDRVGKEQSSQYVRILDLENMKIRAGPKLPIAGGACAAAVIPLEGPEHPPYICSFGGTDGNHDTGTFLPYASCYDRVTEKWVHPFGKLPYGFDHGSMALIPSGVCHSEDPSRILIFNFRTKSYGTQEATILAFDLPSKPWTKEEMASSSAETPGAWYNYANISYTGIEDELNAPRDAAGLVLANEGRLLVNFGGVHYHYENYELKTGYRRRDFSVIRALDVCTKTWSKVGDLGVESYAFQSVASENWNLAFTCGGEARYQEKDDLRNFHRNSQWCIVNRFPGLKLQNHRMTFTKKFPEGFVPGGSADSAFSLEETIKI